ncbi:hypothetical protein GG344DRAFT_82674 [Lentinula edodes]|nr:hypothetical protein GG344DRAFT_82674 [Lentinula edodes]
MIEILVRPGLLVWSYMTNFFLILIADSVYDCGSPSLLFCVGSHLSHSWWDIVVFEARIVKSREDSRSAPPPPPLPYSTPRTRYPRRRVIHRSQHGVAGAHHLGTVFSTIGLARASTCLAASAGAAVITTGNVLTGAGIMGKVTFSLTHFPSSTSTARGAFQ